MTSVAEQIAPSDRSSFESSKDETEATMEDGDKMVGSSDWN